MSKLLKFIKGTKEELERISLSQAEPGYATDEERVFVGSGKELLELLRTKDPRFITLETDNTRHNSQLTNLVVEVGQATLNNTKLYPFNNSEKTIQLGTVRKHLQYTVIAECVPNQTNVGDIEVFDKQLNGFKIKFTGSAPTATINYYVSGGMNV